MARFGWTCVPRSSESVVGCGHSRGHGTKVENHRGKVVKQSKGSEAEQRQSGGGQSWVKVLQAVVARRVAVLFVSSSACTSKPPFTTDKDNGQISAAWLFGSPACRPEVRGFLRIKGRGLLQFFQFTTSAPAIRLVVAPPLDSLATCFYSDLLVDATCLLRVVSGVTKSRPPIAVPAAPREPRLPLALAGRRLSLGMLTEPLRTTRRALTYNGKPLSAHQRRS